MKESIQRFKYILADFITANLAIFLFDIVRYIVLPTQNIGSISLTEFLCWRVILIEQAVLPVMLVCINALSGYYNRPLMKSRLQELITTMSWAFVQTIFIYLLLLTNQKTSVRSTNYELLLYLYMLLFGLTYLGRFAITALALRHYRSGHWKYNVLVIGSAKSALERADSIMQHRNVSGYSLAQVIELPPDNPDDAIDIDQIRMVCRMYNVREIQFTTADMSEETVLKTLYKLIVLDVPVKVSTNSLSLLTSSIRLQSIYEEPYVDISTPNVSDSVMNIKRCIDVVVSSLGLLVLSPVLLVTALLVRNSSPGGAFFKQERIGLRRRPFFIYKFRTMRTDAEAQGPQLSSPNDPRITPLGRKLRKYRIDELPQLWNVLKGDMSLVGPRPERRHFINQIMEYAPYYSLVHQVRPGITSWGMVKYGYASHVSQMVERLRFDLVYLANISLTNDLKIIIYTIKTVLKGRGM